MTETDAELLRRSASGDDGAFEALHARWAPRVEGYLRALLGRSRRTWAEDCLQEVFLKVRSRASSFDGTGAFRSWLFSIAHNEAMDLHRQESRRTELRPRAEPSDPRLEEALGVLPEEIRSAILLVHLEGMTRPEAAATMGVTEYRIQILCRDGIQRLKHLLES